MDQAKQAVKNVLSRGGQHDTVVDERVNPAVTSETIKPTRHEEQTQAVDKEVHQDHYHTTVQPVAHKEVLPEVHTHQQLPVEEREFTHGDSGRIRSTVEAEAAQFADTSRTMETRHTSSAAPAVAAEHVHHHVHETVQPVVHKETIQPEVVHKTIPIHETHHAQAEHHGMSTLPVKTLEEFKSVGGAIAGGSTRTEEYEGHPRPYNPQMQLERSDADHNPLKHDGLHGSHDSATGGSTGLTGTHSSATGGSTGLTGTHGSSTGASTGGLTSTRETNVSSVGNDYSTGTGSTGTALGGRAEGNTATRALESVEGHDTTGTTGTTSNLGYTDSSAERARSTGGAETHSSTKDIADTDDSTKQSKSDHTKDTSSSDIQNSSQGKDPSLVEGKSSGGKWTGEGVDGSHSAVFGLTPDGHKYDDTAHGSTKLKKGVDDDKDTSTGTASRGVSGSGVAEQMHDPRVAEKGHGGSSVSDTGSGKPGAGMTGGSQGLGEIRPEEHGTSGKISDKLDPTTDADGDGKKGVMD